jgi:hypothetical protein
MFDYPGHRRRHGPSAGARRATLAFAELIEREWGRGAPPT